MPLKLSVLPNITFSVILADILPYVQLATSALSFLKTIVESQVQQVLNIGNIRSASTKFTFLYLIYAAGEVSSKLVFFSSDFFFMFLFTVYFEGVRVQELEAMMWFLFLTMFITQVVLALFLWMDLNPLRTCLDFLRVSFDIRKTFSLLVPLNFVTGRREETKWDPFETSV